MKFAFLFLNLLFHVILISSYSFAQVSFQPRKSITLSGSDCSELQGFAENIMTWSKSIRESFDLSVPECFCSGQSCQMNVFDVSPAFVQERTSFLVGEVVSRVDGPNCFNSAFMNSGTVSSMRAVYEDETTSLYESSLCRERPLGEALEPGDIIAIRDQSNKFFEVHAATYISENLYFSKKGFSNFIAYEYSQNDIEFYNVQDPGCKRIYGIPVSGDRCFNKPFVNVFTCKSFPKYISEMGNFLSVMSPDTVALYRMMSRLESKIATLVAMGAVSNLRQKVAESVQELTLIKEAIDQISDMDSYSVAEGEFLTLMKARFTSFDAQLGYFL